MNISTVTVACHFEPVHLTVEKRRIFSCEPARVTVVTVAGCGGGGVVPMVVVVVVGRWWLVVLKKPVPFYTV